MLFATALSTTGSASSALLEPMAWHILATRLIMALVVGSLVGLEREVKEKSAGLRTHMLVSLGSALFVLVPIQLGLPGDSADTLSRVIQGIITGIGFIGGGVILHHNRRNNDVQVRGLTTATSIWIVCGLGMAAGCGLWAMALMTAVFTLIVLTIMKRLERHSL